VKPLMLPLVLIGLLAGAADARPWARYAEVHGIYRKFYAVPAASRDRLQFQLGIKPPEGIGAPEAVQLTLPTRNGARRVAIDQDWTLQLPLDEQLLRDNPTISTNLAAGRPLVLRPQVAFVLPATLTWPGSDLAAAVAQANAAIRSQAGMFSLFAPKAKAVRFRFAEPGATVSVMSAAGSRVIRGDSNGVVEVLLDKSIQKPGVMLVLSAMPKSIVPHFPMTMSLTVDSDGN